MERLLLAERGPPKQPQLGAKSDRYSQIKSGLLQIMLTSKMHPSFTRKSCYTNHTHSSSKRTVAHMSPFAASRR